MTLPNGADVQIGPWSFTIDRTVGGTTSLIRPHYDHSAQTLVAGRTDISGKPGAQNLDQELLLWTYDDWTGGEGNLVYDSTRPFVYDYGTANPRNAGYLTAPPVRTNSQVIEIAPGKVTLVNSAGKLWAIGGSGPTAFAKYSTDGQNWTNLPITISSGYTIHCVCGGGKYVYIASSENAPGTPGGLEIWRIASDGSNDMFATANYALCPVGMCYVGPYIYGWNGVRLGLYDTTQDLPVIGQRVFDSGLQLFPDTFYGDIVPTDNAVAFFYCAPGSDAQVYTFIGGISGAVAPIWGGTALSGFTARAITYCAGMLFLAGGYGTRAFLWGLDVQSNTPLDVGYFRKTTNTSLTPTQMSPGTGSEVMIGMAEGNVFIYDMARDAISELDERAFSLTSVVTFDSQRYACWPDNGVTRVSGWGLDDAAVQTDTYYFVTPVWDFDLPMEERKLLIDVHAITDGLGVGRTLQVEYQLNEDGTWHDMGTVNSGRYITYIASTASTWTRENGQVVSQTDNSIKFAQIRFRVSIKGGIKLYRITFRGYDTEYIERWELVLAMADEIPGSKPSDRTARAYQIRDWMWQQKAQRALVLFKDGFRYPERSSVQGGISSAGRGWTEHTVIVTDISDLVQNVAQKNAGEGIMRVTLRNLSAPTVAATM